MFFAASCRHIYSKYVLRKSVLELREHHALAKTNKVHQIQALAALRSLHSEDKGAPDTVKMVNPLRRDISRNVVKEVSHVYRTNVVKSSAQVLKCQVAKCSVHVVLANGRMAAGLLIVHKQHCCLMNAMSMPNKYPKRWGPAVDLGLIGDPGPEPRRSFHDVVLKRRPAALLVGAVRNPALSESGSRG